MTSSVLNRRFQNQLTKVSDYKQAAQLTVGQLASKTGHGLPGRAGNAKPSQNWEKAHLGSQNQNTEGKKPWPPLLVGHLCRTHKSTTETHFREVSVYMLILFSLWLGKSGAEPWKQTGLYQTGKCLSPRYNEERVLCRNIQRTLSTLNFTGIYYSRIIYYGVGRNSWVFWWVFFLLLFFFPKYTLKVLLMLGNLLTLEKLSVISYQLMLYPHLWYKVKFQLKIKPWEGQLLNGENENKDQNSRLWPFINFIVWSSFPSRALPNLEVVLQKSVSVLHNCFGGRTVRKENEADEARGPDL